MNADFVHWDDSDLDLDEIGLETDRELVVDSEWLNSDGDDSDRDLGGEPSQNRENHPPSKRLKKGNKEKAASQGKYECPKCHKILKTIAGFRGHTSKQHGLDVKAEDYKAKTTNMKKLPLFSGSQLKCVLEVCLTNAVKAVVEDPHRSESELSQKMVHIALTVKDTLRLPDKMRDLLEYLSPMMETILEPLETSVTMTAGREQTWMNFNKLRFDRENMTVLCTLLDMDFNMAFANILLEEVLDSLLTMQVTALQGEEAKAKEDVLISPRDMTVLHYVSGFLIHSLTKRYQKSKRPLFRTLEEAAGKLGESKDSIKHEHLKEFKSWTEKLDRGGLTHPADELFLTVRQMDIVIKNTVNVSSLSAWSLAKGHLQEMVMENFLVKHYMGSLLSGYSAEITATVTEHLTLLYLKVRGHAAAKHIQRKAQKAHKADKSKKGQRASLRKSLRDRDRN